MDPMDPDDAGNATEPEEETVALQKKRSRRVSFADITSIHVFDRDEDFDTPPDQKPGAEAAEPENLNGSLGFQRENAESDDVKDFSRRSDEGEGEEDGGRGFFVRNLDFSSPGSVAGSLTSNDEENYFGPVSTDFIRSGRLSTESADSCNNHDVTLDSTAFSMHFRSLMPLDEQLSESGRFRSPSNVYPESENSPSRESEPSTGGSLMVSAANKKLLLQSTSAGRSGDSDSLNGISVIVSDPHRYDFGKLSPELEALFAESRVGMQLSSPLKKISLSTPLGSAGSKNPIPFSGISGHEEVLQVGTNPVQMKADLDARRKLSSEIRSCILPPVRKVTTAADCSDVDQEQIRDKSHSSEAMLSFPAIKSIEDAHGMGRPQMELRTVSNGVSCSPLIKDISMHYGYAIHDQDGMRKSPLPSPNATSAPVKTPTMKSVTKLLECPSSGGYSQRLGESASVLLKTPTMKIATNLGRSLQSPHNGRYSLTLGNTAELDRASSLSVSFLQGKRRKLFHETTTTSQIDGISSLSCIKRTLSSVNNENPDCGEKLSLSKKVILQNSETQEAGFGHAKPSPLSSTKKYTLFEETPFNTKTNIKSKQPIVSSVRLQAKDALISVEKKVNREAGTEAVSRVTTVEKSVVKEGGKGNAPVVTEHEETHADILPSGTLTVGRPSTYLELEDDIHVQLAKYPGSCEGSLFATPVPLKVETTPQPVMTGQAVGTPNTFIHSSVRMFEQKQSLPVRPKGTPFRSLHSHNQANDLVSASPMLNAEGHITTASDAVSLTQGTVSTPCSYPLQKQSGESFRNTDESFLSSSLNVECYQASMDHGVGMNLHVASQDRTEGRLDLVRLRESSLHGTELQVSHRPSPSITNNNEQSICDYQRSFSVCNVDSPGRTINENLAVMQKENKDANKSGQKDCRVLFKDGRLQVGSFQVEKGHGGMLHSHWKDVCMKSETSGDLIPKSVNFLTSRELNKLQDKLAQLEEFNKYEKLRDMIQCQTMQIVGNKVKSQRIVEARYLLQKHMCERAKLHVLKLKRENLRRKVQQLQSGMKEFCMLKDNFLQHYRVGVRFDEHMEGDMHFVSLQCAKDNQEAQDRVAVMRQKLASLDHNVKKLCRSLHSYGRVKEDADGDEIVPLITDNVQKQICCRNIRQCLQLWELEGLDCKDGHRSIVVNYGDLLSQRFISNVGSMSRVFFFNQLNAAKIKQNFPNINAPNAFEFVFNQKGHHMKCGLRSLKKQIQVTSFLFGNLIDLIEEVQEVHMEIPNLTHVSFHSPCENQLQLQLWFVDFSSARKAKLSLDVTNVLRAVYPAVFLQSQLQIDVCGQRTLLSSEIADVARTLEAGNAAISKFCWSVSQLVKVLSR